MGFPTVTYTFSNGSTADGTQVNQNFTDLINGISDGTKNISVSAVTAAGATNLQGAVTLGASTSNNITFNGSLASSIPILTTFSYDFGSATIGLKSLYLGDAGSAARSTRLISATVASSWTLTLPTTAGTSGQFLKTNGSGVTSWAAPDQIMADYGGTATGTLNNSVNIATFPTVVVDTNSAYSTGTFTVPTAETGIYSIVASVDVTGTYALNSYLGISIYVNGASKRDFFAYAGGAETEMQAMISGIISLTAADAVTIRTRTNATGPAYTNSGSSSFFNIVKVN